MMFPFLKLEDDTEIVHSELLPDERVKVYIEKPVLGGFNHAICYLPDYQWTEISGFSKEDVEKYQKILEATAYIIVKLT